MVPKAGFLPSKARNPVAGAQSMEKQSCRSGRAAPANRCVSGTNEKELTAKCDARSSLGVVPDGRRVKKRRRDKASELRLVEGDTPEEDPSRKLQDQQYGDDAKDLEGTGQKPLQVSVISRDDSMCHSEDLSGEHPTAADATSHEECKSAYQQSLWGGRRCVLLFTYCPLLLIRPRVEKARKPNKRSQQSQQPRSALLTADEHSQFLKALEGGDDTYPLGRAKNPLQPVVRRVQLHLREVANQILGTDKTAKPKNNDPSEGSIGASLNPVRSGLVRDASVSARMRECVLSVARKVSAASAETHWIATACMRPDIVHQCLLSALDSALLKQMRHLQQHQRYPSVDILLHTLDGKLLRVSYNFRVPRTFRVFKKVAEMLLSSSTGKLEVPNQHDSEDASTEEKPLIELLQPPFWRHFPQKSRWVAFSEARDAPAVALRPFVEGLPTAVDASLANDFGLSDQSHDRTGGEGSQDAPATVFVLSASQAVDSALVPPCLLPPVDDANSCSHWHSLTTVRTSSYSVPAALRCDRLLLELSRER